MRRTMLLWALLVVGCGRCGGESVESVSQPVAEALRCARMTAIPMDREAQTFGLTLADCSDGETRTLSCQQPVTNFPAECTCPGGSTFAMIPMDFLPRDVPLWKLPNDRVALWERIFAELVAGGGEQARDVVAERCELPLAGAEPPGPVLPWLWELPKAEAEAALEAAFGSLPERQLRDPDDMSYAWDEVRGPATLGLGALESAEAGSPCRFADASESGERSWAGRCHLVAPNVLELRPAPEEGPPVEDGRMGEGRPTDENEGAGDAAAPLRLGVDPVDGLTLRLAPLLPGGEPATLVRRLPLNASGQLTVEELEEVRPGFQPSIDACVAAYEGPPVEGFVAVQFVVSAGGRPGNAGVRSSSIAVESVEEC
ncbi:MAG: hypothetical protein AAF447_25560, partial [Myxococcota bacterium]